MLKHYTFDGHRVSKPWYLVLTHLRRTGVDFHLNDGQRTLAAQRARVRKHGLWSPSNPTGAARPSLAAPHILFRRADHALDVDKGVEHLQIALRKLGVKTCRPIAAEPWHVQVDRGGLLKLAKHIAHARHTTI